MAKRRTRVVRPSGGEPTEERCIVLCARLGRGAAKHEASAIADTLNAAEANGWWFLSPGTAIAVFVARASGAERAAACEAALRRLDLPLGIATAEGAVAATFTASMLVESMPVGEVVAEAVRAAM